MSGYDLQPAAAAEYEPSDHAVDSGRILAAWLLLAAFAGLAVEVPSPGAANPAGWRQGVAPASACEAGASTRE